jgi:hypothetical protein
VSTTTASPPVTRPPRAAWCFSSNPSSCLPPLRARDILTPP